MTITETEHTESELPPHHRAHEHEHPSDLQYLMVALILAVITAAEVGTYFLEDPSTTLLLVSLIPMMLAKFIIVAGWFMHLRYDNPIFRRVFIFGLVLAVAVYAIALTSMQYFSDRWLGG